jgi:leucyl/phenylalanyl-tRNA--protein transferase
VALFRVPVSLLYVFHMGVEPPRTVWDLPRPHPGDDDLVGVGGDLEPGTLLAAYRAGLFPMPMRGLRRWESRPIVGWWSPDPRGVLPLRRLHVSRSLRRSLRHFEVRVDTAFADVVAGCADPARSHGWITPAIAHAYVRLHELGWAHSVEAWAEDGSLAGGLYGVAVGGLFAAESKFHRRTDASKAALVGLVRLLDDEHADQRILDVQWTTPHLRRLGAVDVPRTAYLDRLGEAIELPLPAAVRR